MPRWEYKTFRWEPVGNEREIFDSDFKHWENIVDKWLCRLGVDGWEVIKVDTLNWQVCVLMKRPF